MRQQAALCGFDKYSKKTRQVLTDMTITDVIVEGCLSVELRRRMLLKDRSLDEIEEIASGLEGVDSQIQDLAGKSNESNSADKVYKVKDFSSQGYRRPLATKFRSGEGRYRGRPAVRHTTNVVCFNCGKSGHISSSDSCPAKGKQCRNCKRVGHFDYTCKSSRSSVKQTSFSPPSKKIRVVEEKETREADEGKVYYAFFNGNLTNMLTFEIGGVSLDMLVDSGADANLVTSEAWEKLKQAGVRVTSSTKESDRSFLSYGSSDPLAVRGKFTAEIKIQDRLVLANFYVVEKGQTCLLGDVTAKQLQVLQVGANLNRVEKSDPFTCIKDVEVHIHMDPEAKPVVQPVRRLPIPLEAEVNRKLDEMLSRDIIEPKLGPTTWVSPLVVVAKANGGLRLCVDLRRVNQSVLREHHPMPVIDHILARIGTGVVWSKLDIRDSFLQIMVAAESRDILTFITEKGLFRCKRLPFGLITAPEIFQRVIDEILCGCEGTHWYLDDIFVEGETLEEHDARLEKVMAKLKERGVQLNMDKCRFRVTELEFLGYKISESGIAPSEAKVEAIIAFRRPANEGEIRSFLGLANYLNRYIPHLATLDEPLRELTRKGVKFSWDSRHETSFQAIKRAMSDVRILGFYDARDRTAVIADASPTGLGAMLVQTNRQGHDRVVSFASKSLTATERRYCQTEKEALGLVWAVEKFQFYLLGRKFDLVTDCKALVYLFTPRSKPCSRIERWVLRLQCFNYSIVHIRGDQNAADALSRLSCTTVEPFDSAEELVIQHIASVSAESIAVSWQEILRESRDDAEIMNILKCIMEDTIELLPAAYRIISAELCDVGGVLLRGDRIVVPAGLRQRVLTIAHDGHPGVRMMKSYLRSVVWWPKLDADTENFVKNCRGCTLVAAPDAPEPMLRRSLPSGPWEDIAIDYLGPLPGGQNLLVIVDCYSRYLEVCEMTCIDSTETISRLREVFGRFGIPSLIKADNGPQFASTEFKNFCRDYGIHLVNTIPYWPQMNGQVERQNRSILKRLRIAQELGKDWRKELHEFLLVYHATNHATTGEAPSKLMFGRRIRGRLPYVPVHYEDEAVRDVDGIQKEKGKNYSDGKRRATYSEIREGDKVFVKRMKKNHKLEADYSAEEYDVVNKKGSDVIVRSRVSGKEFRRNVTHLKKVPQIDDNVQPTATTETDQSTSSEVVDGRMDETVQLTETPSGRKRERQQPTKFKDYVPF